MPSSNQRRRCGTRAPRSRAQRIAAVSLATFTPSTLYGRQSLLSVSTNGSGIIALASENLNPLTLGDRPAAVAAAFLRYKFKWVKFYWKSRLSSAYSGKLFMGVADDIINTTNPSTGDQVLNLRTSQETAVWKNSVMTWIPPDRMNWYYVNADSVAEPRLVDQGAFFLIGDATAIQFASAVTTTLSQASLVSGLVGEVDIEYCIVFDSASISIN